MPEPLSAAGSSLSLTGIAASPGYAEGPLAMIDRPLAAYAARGAAAAEAGALAAAIEAAVAVVADMAANATGEAADMLEFQLAMLSDDALSGPAFAAIADGTPADAAWRGALDTEIDGYRSSDEDYFRARAADLTDIRDQVLLALAGEDAVAIPPGAILIGDDITPTRFLSTDWDAGGGIALASGSTASHVAMLARSRGVPMVVGFGPALLEVRDGHGLLDAEHARLAIDPSPEATEDFAAAAARFQGVRAGAAAYLAGPARTADGVAIRVQVNIADPADIERIDVSHCDGVGLMRTEFLFGKPGGLPDEETQFRAYRKLLDWAGDRPVTIRTVDAGGDKPVSGFTVEEGNPFLGLRGIRLSLARPDIFRVQIRALLRAAVHGRLKVMFPMVAVADEYQRAAGLFREEAAGLASAGVPHAMPPLGIMVEVPSVAIAPELFSDVAFFSIGSNDLTQYVMAAARDNAAVAALNTVTHPAVLRLIDRVCAFAAESGIPVSLCGDAGGDPAAIPHLIAAGLRDLSVVPAQLAVAKAAIASVSLPP